MYSWKSRFRKTKTPDVAETKPASNLSKNPDETDQQKKRISRFLRRSKHEDDTHDRSRPRSVFLERNTTEFSGNQKATLGHRNLGDPPSVQEILDRNRRERAAGKNPRPWRMFLTGDRSPNANKQRESGNGEKDDYLYKNRYRDENKNYDNDRYDTNSQISNDSDKYGRRERYSEERAGRKIGMKDTRNERKASNDGSQRSGSDNSSEKVKKHRSRSASPYDNVEEGSKRWRERKSHSLYIETRNGDSHRDSETSSIADKSVTPRSKRRERMRRSESQDTVNSEKSVQSKTWIEKETYVSRRPQMHTEQENEYMRKPRGHAEEERGSNRRDWKYRGQNENKMDDTRDEPRSQNEKDTTRKSPRVYRKLSDGKASGYSTEQSVKDEKVNRVYERGAYIRRSSENILGATFNYIERKTSIDHLGKATTKIIEEVNESPRERRRRIRGLRNDNAHENGSVPDSECESTSGAARRKYSYGSKTASYKSSTETTSYKSNTGRSDSYAKTRPRSLYDFHESLSVTDSRSKYKEDGSGVERYRSRNDYAAKDEQQSVLRRPKTLFMVDDEKKENAYRGNWSVSVPKRPDHLKDFSKPDETSAGYSWRKSKREKQEEIESGADSAVVDAGRGVKRAERILIKERNIGRVDDRDTSYNWQRNRKEKQEEGADTGRYANEKEATNDDKEEKSSKGERVSYIRRQSQQSAKNSEEKPELKIPAFEFTVSHPKDEETEEKGALKKDNRTTALEEDTVVRRRRREHAPPARPSSFYCVNVDEDKLTESTFRKTGKKTGDDKDEDDDDDESKRRLRRKPNVNLDSEDIKAGLRKKSAVERRLRNKYIKERPKSVNLADVFAVSNERSSSYATKVKIHDPLHDTVDDVKREFEKLLRRTEDWKLRTESLNSKATVLSSSYRSLNKAITGIRDESDDMYAVIENIGERLNVNDSIGYPDTEDEWRRAFEAGKLVEKALRGFEYQKRNPKPEFEYSDSESEEQTQDKPFYDMPAGIPWFSQRTSRENSGNRLSSLTDQYSARRTSDYLENNSQRYPSYRPSLDVTSNISVSTSTRFSPSYVSDVYTRRNRYQDSIIDYRGSSSGLSVSSSSNGRIIPETAV